MTSYREGYLAGILATSWTCGDCGNTYDASVDHCPNTLLDAAYLSMFKEPDVTDNDTLDTPDYRRGRLDERGMWFDIVSDRLDDLMYCGKNDDCRTKAEGVQLVQDDALYAIKLLGD